MSTERLASPLSVRCSRLLRHGDGWERYASTHQVLAALTGGMVKAGWTVDQACEALTDQRNEAARRLTYRYGGGVISAVCSKFLASQRKAERQSAQAQAWVDTLVGSWPHGGRYGATLRVAIALAVLADEAGKFSFTASHRRICEVAGVGSTNIRWTELSSTSASWVDTTSVRKALKQLTNWGYVSVTAVSADTPWKATIEANTVYSLVSLEKLNELLQMNSAMYSQTPTKGLRPVRRISGGFKVQPSEWLHVVWEHAALGMSAARIYFSLKLLGPLTISQLQAGLRLSRNCVNGSLKRLDESRLVEQQSARGGWRAAARNLDDLAEELNVSMRQQARAIGIERQRRERLTALKQGRPSTRRTAPNSPVGVDPITGELVGRQAERCTARLLERAGHPFHEWLPQRHREGRTAAQTARTTHRRTKVSSGLNGAYRPSMSSLVAKHERANRGPFDDPPTRRHRQLQLTGARHRAEVTPWL